MEDADTLTLPARVSTAPEALTTASSMSAQVDDDMDDMESAAAPEGEQDDDPHGFGPKPQTATSLATSTGMDGAGSGMGVGASDWTAALDADLAEHVASSLAQDQLVALSVVVLPQGMLHRCALPVTARVADLAAQLRRVLKLGDAELSFAMSGDQLNDAWTLSECGLNVGDDAQLALTVLPQRIETVFVPSVSVVRDTTLMIRKPFLGGRRNRLTGTEYHDASSQANAEEKIVTVKTWAPRCARETQTVRLVTHNTQTAREAATQMSKPGVDVDDRSDRVITPGVYVLADEVLAVRVRMAIRIQAAARGWFARRRARLMRRSLEERRRLIAETEAQRIADAERKRQHEIDRRMRPRSEQDFLLLYNELEAWRVAELQRINATAYTPEERQQVLAELLAKETQLLQTVDRLRTAANIENRDLRIDATLGIMAKPKKWAMSDGAVVDVHTPFTIRAKELADLYAGLRLPLLTVDERLDVLLHIKWTVKEFDCDLSREIVELIDREADLLHRGRPEDSLVGLRKRLLTLFLQFIETPEFNPEAARFQKVPNTMLRRQNTRPSKAKGARGLRSGSGAGSRSATTTPAQYRPIP